MEPVKSDPGVLTCGRRVTVDLHLTQRQVPSRAMDNQGHNATHNSSREPMAVCLTQTDGSHRGHPDTEQKKKTISITFRRRGSLLSSPFICRVEKDKCI